MKIKLIIFCFMLITLFCPQSSFAGRPSGKGGSPAAPTVYTFDDLNTAAQNYKSDFYFDASNKPSTAVATLPTQTPNAQPSWLVASTLRRRGLWGYSTPYLSFPMNDSRIMNGDVVFIRGGEGASKVIRNFSTWTHTAMIYDKANGKTFESQKSSGVALYDYSTAWPDITAYSVKRIRTDAINAIERAKTYYSNKPYIPYWEVVNGFPSLLRKWSEKHDFDSMYCSKLVYWTFKDYYNEDLDSERTSSRSFGESATVDDGSYRVNSIAWIGVSPDDIYYSRKTGSDILLAGSDQLLVPLSDSIF
ncbi:MAG: hypothetical protein WC890_05995 [Candidatus Margulisiibacteriota bacterium]